MTETQIAIPETEKIAAEVESGLKKIESKLVQILALIPEPIRKAGAAKIIAYITMLTLAAAGKKAYVKSGAIIGEAPNLQHFEIEV